MFPRQRLRVWSAIAAVLMGVSGAVVGALFGAGVAHAVGDNTLSSSNPAPSENVTVAPTQLQLVFTNPLANPNDVNQMGLSLVCNGNIVSLGAAQLGTDLKTVSAPLTQVPNAGACVVSWALPDGSSGAFSFTSSIAAPTTSTSTPTGPTVPEPVKPGSNNPVVDKSPRVGGPLGLVGFHHGEVEDDGLPFPQSLDRPGHLIKTAGFHEHDFGHGVGQAGHADDVGAGEGIVHAGGEIRAQGQCGGAAGGWRGRFVALAGIVIQLIVEVAIEVIITGDDGTETGEQRHE